MKTIYFYGMDNVYGGIENYSFNLIKGILDQTKDFHFHIISSFEDFAYKNKLIELGCSYSIVPNKLKKPFSYKKRLINILKKANKNDIFHVNIMSYRNFLLFNAIKKTNVKSIIVGHSTSCNNKLSFFIHKMFSKKYEKIGKKIAVNELVTPFMFRNKNEVQIIPNGIVINTFKYNEDYRREIRVKYRINDSHFIIGQIGRISQEKNQVFSCEIMKLLASRNDIHLYLFGKNTNSKILRRILSMNLSNVHYIGEVQETYKLYSAFDLFIMPSTYESAGISLYEALANNLPCIISTNIPTTNLDLSNTKILSLQKDAWKKEIENSLNKKRTRINCSAIDNETQITNYISLYNSI